MPPNTVSCTRPGKFGNPYAVGDTVRDLAGGNGEIVTIRDDHHAVELYRRCVEQNLVSQDAIRRELTGKNVACWCKVGHPCHVQDVIIPLISS